MAAYPESSTATTAPQPLALALPRAGAPVVAVFGAAIFAGATLVFLIQPIAARMVLPLFGGSQAVWTTSMLFFQAVLLAGYAYSHLAARYLRRAPLVHVALLLLPIATLPIGRHLAAPPDGFPASLWLLGVLAVSVGAPFAMVTTASPTLQHWFSRTGHKAARDPYFLYAAGNAGSLLALVLYPLLVEPNLSLDVQARLWTAGYAVFVALSLGCLVLLRRHAGLHVPARVTRSAAPALPARTRLRWVLFAFVPSSLLLGATSWISTDIASAPLLWIAPLAVYLLTFIVAFSRFSTASVHLASALIPFVAAAVLASLLNVFDVFGIPIAVAVGLHLLALLCTATLVHGRLAAERPGPERLTEFYVLLSVGGVLGGVFNALLAPVLFDTVLEYPLALVLALLLRPARAPRTPSTRRFAWTADFLLPFGLFLGTIGAIVASSWGDETPEPGGVVTSAILAGGAGALLLFARNRRRFAVGFALFAAIVAFGQPALHSERTFYGVLRVVEGPRGEHYLQHGTTLHGVESFTPGRVGEPLSYYTRTGPIGDVFDLYQAEAPFERVGLVGLGVGTLAAYGRAGQTFEFYELDPAVIQIASDPRYFTFLRDTKAEVRTVPGDARRSLAEAPRGTNDLLVVDAFSSDSIPVHLLTREAVQLYLGTLRAQGVVAFHVSNRHLRLAPVVAGIADSLGLAAAHKFHLVTAAAAEQGAATSHWIVLARSQDRLAPLLGHGWEPLHAEPGDRVWTDDYSNVLGAIDWSG
jgi:hypothetical protein